ncbi:MAG TPA: AraC family transcriptional regulator [Aldersonia sp.]
MDALADLLSGPRAKGAFLVRSIMTAPWSMRIEDRAPLTVFAVVHGAAWVRPDDGAAIELRAGDVVLARGPDPYLVADDPATPPQVVIGPGQECRTLYGEPLQEKWRLGVRSWGNSRNGETVLLTGTYQMAGEVSRRVLDSLPTLAVLRAAEWNCPVLPLLEAEIVKDDPGQEVVLDRLLDLLTISALRAWFARADADVPGWYRADADSLVGHALRLIHHNPAHPWTVAALAAGCGVSRAVLARRFADLVGEPPMSYLTGWRLAVAADLLQEGDETLDAVARRVGYGSGFALSAAFKRVRGVRPSASRLAG